MLPAASDGRVRRWPGWGVLGAGVLVLAALAAVVRLVRRRPTPEAITPPPLPHSTGDGTWSPLTPGRSIQARPSQPSARAQHTAVWTGAEILVWGGRRDGPMVLGDGGGYDPRGDRWRPLAAAGAPSPRFGHTAVWTGSEMLVWGGYGCPYWCGDGARYDPEHDVWAPVADEAAPPARSEQTAVWTGGAMVVWGGATGSLSYAQDGGSYAPPSSPGAP
jgi:hypothetical protein